jgi:hypothetical protein
MGIGSREIKFIVSLRLAALALAEIRTRCQWNLVTVKSDRFGSRKLRDPFINVCKMAFSTGG